MAGIRKDEGPARLARELFAGCMGGVLTDLIVHPADTIRARLQVQSSAPGVSAIGEQARYTGTLDCARTMVRTEGWRSLYKGFRVVGMMSGPAHALYFGGYEWTKRRLPGPPRLSSTSTRPVVAWTRPGK